MSPDICYLPVSVSSVQEYRNCSHIGVAGWDSGKGQNLESLPGVGWIRVRSHLHSKTDMMDDPECHM